MSARRRLSRRQFLASYATASAALVVGFRLAPEAGAQGEARPGPSPFDAWIRVGSDGTITLLVAKSEMGQGVFTTLPMLLAEELGVDFAAVEIAQAPTNPRFYDHGTGGSTSVRTSYEPLRRAAAAARAMLVGAAAERWGVPVEECRVENGAVLGTGGRRAAYGELAPAAAARPVPDLAKVELRDSRRWTLLGTSPPRRDIPAKVDGSARFGLDARVPGMLFAVVARCPTLGGSAKSWNETAARAIPGVRAVLPIPPVREGNVFATGGVAVVADSSWAAIRGREALAVVWEPGSNVTESSDAIRGRFEEALANRTELVAESGEALAAVARAARRLEATYDVPFEAHAPMEPLNATVHVRDDGAEAWLGSQRPDWPQREIARVAGVDPARVVVHNLFLGGAFGRRYNADAPVEAAQISKAVRAPVQVLWTREDDIRHDFFRPAARHRLVAALDADSKPIAWVHRMASPSIGVHWGWGGKPASSEVGGAVDLPYDLPARRMEFAHVETAVPIMWWRSVEHSGNAFVVESFVDELAHAAGEDPLAFRLRLLAGNRSVALPGESDAPPLETARLAGVLALAAEKAGWGTAPPAGRARGIAAHYSFHSYVAHVAEVGLVGGKPRVHRVVSAVDCGRVLHPDNLAAQVEGAIVFGLTATLGGAITIEQGRVAQGNFDDYPMLRIDAMPTVEVHAVASDRPPTGIGEPGLPPIAPAVANALFALTGKRVRKVPILAADLT